MNSLLLMKSYIFWLCFRFPRSVLLSLRFVRLWVYVCTTVEEDDEESDFEDLAEANEDVFDRNLAWKMLDVARAIVKQQFDETIEKVDKFLCFILQSLHVDLSH